MNSIHDNNTIISIDENSSMENKKNLRVHENPIYGDKAIFLKTSDETNGSFTQIEIELAIKGGNTKHYHASYTEKFTVTEGNLTLYADGDFKLLRKGESFLVNPGVVHFFRNDSPGKTKFLIEFRPGQPGFEKTLMIGYGLAKDGLTNKKGVPKKFSHLALLITLSDTQIPGPFKLISPVFKWMANRAVKRGELQKLIDRYCKN